MSQRFREDFRWKCEKSKQNIAMNEEFGKNSVRNAQKDPKVVMDLSILKFGAWNNLQSTNHNFLEEFIDDNEPLLLSGISSRGCAREGQISTWRNWCHFVKVFVMVQCHMRQHFADRYWLRKHPGGHASWREPTMRKFTKELTTYFVRGPVCRWRNSRMRSESSECVLRELLWRASEGSLGEALDESLRCRPRCRTRILQNW